MQMVAARCLCSAFSFFPITNENLELSICDGKYQSFNLNEVNAFLMSEVRLSVVLI
jgi:hypothetical protein